MRTMVVKTRVIPFASIMGMLPNNMPYTNQRKMPASRETHIRSEMSLVSLILMILKAWGTKEKVVHAAATSPIMVIMLIDIVSQGTGLVRANPASQAPGGLYMPAAEVLNGTLEVFHRNKSHAGIYNISEGITN